MAFSHRIATLTAVVAIPLGIAATSYALTDSPDPPDAPAKVELDSRSPSPGPSDPSGPSEPARKGSSSPSPSTSPGDEAVPRPSATDDTDDNDDDADDGAGDDG